MRPYIKIVMPIIVLLMLCSFAYAADETDQGDWEFSLAPLYLWAVSLEGEVTMRDQTAPLELAFGDIFDNLAAVFTVHFEG